MAASHDYSLLLSCEHASNHVPSAYRELLGERHRLLNTHAGYDIGALELAQLLAARLQAPLFAGGITRLLVDLNRSAPNRRSPATPGLGPHQRDIARELLARYHQPYRQQVTDCLASLLKAGPVLHLSVHSFTPVLRGETRRADLGFLYDPGRPAEKTFCTRWRDALAGQTVLELRLRSNYPYRGVSDGLVSALRQHYPASDYLGIELEVNQSWPLGNQQRWQQLQKLLAASLGKALRVD